MSETPMKISIDLVMKADEALKDTATMDKYVEQLNQRLEQMANAAKTAGFEIDELTAIFKMTEKVTAMSAARLFVAFAGIIALAQNAFNSMATWSPSLAAQLGLAKLNMGLLAMEMGENLAPIIENIVVPATEFLLEKVNEMNPTVKQVIAVFVALIPVAATLAVGLFFLSSGFLSILAPILLIILGIALLVVGFNGLIESFKSASVNELKTLEKVLKGLVVVLGVVAIVMGAIAIATGAALLPVILLIGAIVGLILLLKFLDKEIAKRENKPATQMDAESTMATGTQKGTVDHMLANPDEYHSGGVFAGDRPGLAMLKPRERVLTPTEQRSLGLLGGGGSGTTATVNNTYNITIQGGSYSSPAARRMEAEKFAKQLETQSNARGFV